MKETWDGRPLYDYESETIVEDIKTTYFSGDRDMRQYIARQRDKNSWKKAISEIMRNFNIDDFEPLYYCRKCRRIEDGSHRYFIAMKKKIPTLNAIIGDECFKHIKSKSKENGFEETMKKYGKSLTIKDYKWLRALAKDKIPHFSSSVDFSGKSHLDIGCHVGFMCIEAHKRGARLSVGIDIRADVLSIANMMVKNLSIPEDKICFYQVDFRKSLFIRFSIVSCFGLLHYFGIREYPAIFDRICAIADETLLLEMRISPSGVRKLADKNGQTRPSDSWVIDRLNKNGYYVIKSLHRGTDRYLYVGKKISKTEV